MYSLLIALNVLCVIVALLECRSDSQTSQGLLCVVNTHLLYNPKRGELKLGQVRRDSQCEREKECVRERE